MQDGVKNTHKHLLNPRKKKIVQDVLSTCSKEGDDGGDGDDDEIQKA